MNLIDYHVTKVISTPIKRTLDNGKNYWKVLVEYWDDGGPNQTMNLIFFNEKEANDVKVGYVGQH